MPIYKYIDKKFFKNWSSNMAYIFGFIYADGTITITKRNTHYFAIHSSDKNLLEKIKALIGADHKLSKRSFRSGEVYRLQIGSKEMVKDLIILGMDTTKASRMKFPKIPKIFIGDFVRGYFDGDGNIWVGKIHKDRKIKSLGILTVFTSASYLFLEQLQDKLQTLGIKGGSLYTHKTKNYSRLSLSKSDSLKLYKIMYNGVTSESLYLQRKKKVFDAFLNKMRT